MNKGDYLDRIIRRHLASAAVRAVLFTGLTILFFTCVFGVETIEKNDMFPAIHAGDVVVFYRLGEVKRDDVVLYGSGTDIGRVLGMEPDCINITDDGELTINGYVHPAYQNRGIFYDTYKRDAGIGYPVKLKKGEIFILGDKRDTAVDSRTVGVVRKDKIIGRVFIVIRRRVI